ncbi:hydrolase [Kitasatospora herbaricolor]|uniref:alpha/beta fold hydrolase n=1 Tax=Kitasatospora herbaricolor TaxID=68217 RepID=UPI00174818D4|nr:alpha/beta hydrolase [Kitasatospora herbaricolor]MDQ0309948.1 pimeloyl-ACP methyl ester carboxylesterase [Kitasatospora herbaricolor]GGV32487.1 hydrolase [Kitasatospora herbaricolor]
MSTTPLATRYLDVPGGRIAFDDTEHGSGAPVLLIPGMLDSRSAYRHLHPLLAGAGHRVITMDIRGFGESSIEWDDYTPAAIAQDALALLDHLGIERAVLVGSSYTGASVVKVAGDAPDRVAGIALLDAFVENLPPTAFQRGLVKVLGTAVIQFPAFWGMYQKLAFPTAKPADFAEYRAELVASLRTPGRKTATRGYVRGDSAPVGWSAAVTCPALVVMGSKDPDFPKPEVVADRQAAALNARKVMIEGAGHYPMAEFPQATADALVPFLASLTESRPSTADTQG